MTKPLDIHDLDTLKELSIAQLQQMWREHPGRKTRRQEPPGIKSLLVCDLAWYIQQQTHGGHDAQTQSLLRTAIKQAQNNPTPRNTRPQSAGTSSDPSKPHSRKKSRWTKPQLHIGTKLVRTWRGKTYEVQVVQGRNGRKRYRLGGQEYRSLTVIAQEITGTHWSGPRFFGLHRVRSIR